MPSLRFDQNIFELQPLEIRRLLTTAVVGANNTLDILGTAANDTITVNRNSAGRLTVTGVATQFNIGSGANQVNKILIQGSGGSDTILLTNNVRFPSNNAGIPSTIAGNAGNDTITGGPGNDIINGNDGNDRIDGGGGNDELTGGANFDTANYSTRTVAIDVDIDNVADDGQGSIGEADNVTTSIEEVIGGSANDTIVGSATSDFIGGGGGNDSMSGGDGSDQLTGSAGADKFFGQNGNDFLFAQNSDQDTVNGGTNSDGTPDTDFASLDPIDVAAAFMARAAGIAAATGATLDPSFDDNGIAVGPSNLAWTPTATAVDDQGRIYFVGTQSRSNGQAIGQDIVVARFTSTGAFDTTFGQNGVAAVDFTFFNGTGSGYNDDESGEGIAIDDEGNIIVVGSTAGLFDSDSDFAIARLTPDGNLDTSFNDGGLQTVDVVGTLGAGYNDEAFDVAVQADGKIVVVGEYVYVIGGEFNRREMAAARLTADGLIDDSDTSPESHFATNGSRSYSLGEFASSANAVALQPQEGGDNIIMAGFIDGAAAVVAVEPSGELDFGFGQGDGVDMQSFGGSAAYNDVAVNSQNQIVAVGDAVVFPIGLEGEITPQGLSPIFGAVVVVLSPGANGAMSSQFFAPRTQGGTLTFSGVDTDADDNIVVAGAEEGDYVTARFRMVEGDNDGTPFVNDDTFAPGLVFTDLSTDESPDPGFNQHDEGIGAFALPDGKIVVAGLSRTASQTTTISAIRFGARGVVPPPNREAEVTEVEEFLSYDDLHDPNTNIFDNVSATARFYALSQHDDNGVARLDLPPDLDKANVINIYNVMAGDDQINVAVDVDGLVLYYDPDDCTRIEIYSKNFNDIITADNDVAIPLVIDAGDGNDSVTGGGEDDVIFGGAGNDYINGNDGDDAAVGGAGNDYILGWRGHDILIGGLGTDVMFGYFGDNILVGGFTDHDTNVDALDALIAEWTSGDPNRINNIRNGGGLNGDVKLRTGIGATAFDDNARDFLTLGGNGDWFFLKNRNPNRDVTPAGNASTNDFL